MGRGSDAGGLDRKGEIRLVRPTLDAPDLSLHPGSPGTGAVSPSIEPWTDAVGALRPLRWNADVGALQVEPAQIAPGRAIGRVALGASRASVDQALGKGATRVRSGVTLITYRRFGAHLLVQSVGGVVVGVGTTSRYYVTASGLGVGSPATAVAG